MQHRYTSLIAAAFADTVLAFFDRLRLPAVKASLACLEISHPRRLASPRLVLVGAIILMPFRIIIGGPQLRQQGHPVALRSGLLPRPGPLHRAAHLGHRPVQHAVAGLLHLLPQLHDSVCTHRVQAGAELTLTPPREHNQIKLNNFII